MSRRRNAGPESHATGRSSKGAGSGGPGGKHAAQRLSGGNDEQWRRLAKLLGPLLRVAVRATAEVDGELASDVGAAWRVAARAVD